MSHEGDELYEVNESIAGEEEFEKKEGNKGSNRGAKRLKKQEGMEMEDNEAEEEDDGEEEKDSDEDDDSSDDDDDEEEEMGRAKNAKKKKKGKKMNIKARMNEIEKEKKAKFFEGI